MEVDQFISPKKAGMKACKLCRDGSSYQECSQEGQQETNEAEEDNILRKLCNYFRYFSVFFSVSSDNTIFSFMLGACQLGRMGKRVYSLKTITKRATVLSLGTLVIFLELHH